MIIIEVNSHARLKFPDNQYWLPIQLPLRLVDETALITDDYHVVIANIPDPDHDDTLQVHNSSAAAIADPFTRLTTAEPYPPGDRAQEHQTYVEDARSTDRSSYMSLETIIETDTGTREPFNIPNALRTQALQTERVDPDSTATKTTVLNEQEVFYIEHFVKHVAPWIDIDDALCLFAYEVPRRAMNDAALLMAVLAVASKHLSAIASLDASISDSYYQRSIEALTPTLRLPGISNNDNIMATTVLLRFWEEFGEPLTGLDISFHLFGAKVLIDASADLQQVSPLQVAAQWLGLRQEVRIAFLTNRAVSLDLHRFDKFLDESSPLSPDRDWSYRMFLILARTLNWCFADRDRQIAEYDDLVQQCSAWMLQSPVSFQPIFKSDNPESHPWPKLRFLNASVVFGLQHWYLTRIVLLSYNPRAVLFGPQRQQYMSQVNAEIVDALRYICSIGHSNQQFHNATVIASLALSMCGERFGNAQERDAAEGILDIARVVYGVPTLATIEQLRRQWL
ncbi:hypothetical protein PFICI_07973 [Pestalotiopsis fici W106-1]|uniref:Transcription factor domain-containing protein n=1 Tax=Pestalotiopsis fici (strain W106-1 / CGMCC3.15140) TaxID=1229662 RepID=W3X360_PESFW|nr:uncharacterized protein PFICI_07973 [Pestalotiopsis fici W106-1]ETS80444.1 hypothetical protein PFICI_07973 [Pestalotiopsis fici W106-1]